jgi:hypothetical protein
MALCVQVQESGVTVRRMLQLMRDAAFLDDRSDLLRGLFITYNHPSETFCTIEFQLVQGRNGAFHGQVLLFYPVRTFCYHNSASTMALFLACLSASPMKPSCILGMLGVAGLATKHHWNL